ncbi:MAG: HNH endonuclease family protein [Planctomycetota bacterium]|jgi:uncharacterized protein (TIGR02646 family)
MINIRRCACPSTLSQGYTLADKCCKKEVVLALHGMQHGKCCYCEKEIATEGQEQAIEHFRPKAPDRFPELENTWTNLLHACSCCNGWKWSHFPTDRNGNPLLLDPSDLDVDPEDDLEFHTDDEDDLNWGRVSPRNGSPLGDKTIEIVGLDKVNKRRERVAEYNKLFAAYVEIKNAQDEITKRQKIAAFEAMLSANNAHAGFARAFARNKRLDSRFEVRIPVGAEAK